MVGVLSSLFAGFVFALVIRLAGKRHMTLALVLGAVAAGIGLVITFLIDRARHRTPAYAASVPEGPRFELHNVHGDNYAAETMHITLGRVAPEAHWVYGVIVRNESVGTDDAPCYSTRFAVRIDANYAADRIKLIGITQPSPTRQGFLPRVWRPDGRALNAQNSQTVGGATNSIAFDNPPKDLVFEVLTAEEQDVQFDCELN